MKQTPLEKARQFEVAHEFPKERRPLIHVTPRSGWLNDPNGLSYYNGEYHLFFQYHPYDSFWGPMHWGHVTSQDMLHWEYQPVALAPGEEYDLDGCFSGSAITLEDGRHLLMYTGFRYDPEDPKHRGIQNQNLAIGDGRNYEKYSENPVLTVDDMPKGSNQYDFRDPKLWQLPDGTYRCVVACRNEAGFTQVQQLSSPDAFHWKFHSVLLENHDSLGKMWECPDLFPLDETHVLLISAMDMEADDREHVSGNNNVYFLGDYDGETFLPKAEFPLDQGIDFYAGTTLVTPDGRRVVIGWMQSPDTTTQRSRDHEIFGQLTLPRELSVKNGRLYQWPIRELENYQKNLVSYQDYEIANETVTLPSVEGRTLDMTLQIRPKDQGYTKFQLKFAKDDRHYCEISYEPSTGTITMDRSRSGNRRAMVTTQTAHVSTESQLDLRLILDKHSAELFINGGEKVMTMVIDTEQSADGITFGAEGALAISVTKYELVDETIK